MLQGTRRTQRTSFKSLFFPCGAQGLNSGHESWQQVPLPTCIIKDKGQTCNIAVVLTDTLCLLLAEWWAYLKCHTNMWMDLVWQKDIQVSIQRDWKTRKHSPRLLVTRHVQSESAFFPLDSELPLLGSAAATGSWLLPAPLWTPLSPFCWCLMATALSTSSHGMANCPPPISYCGRLDLCVSSEFLYWNPCAHDVRMQGH